MKQCVHQTLHFILREQKEEWCTVCAVTGLVSMVMERV